MNSIIEKKKHLSYIKNNRQPRRSSTFRSVPLMCGSPAGKHKNMRVPLHRGSPSLALLFSRLRFRLGLTQRSWGHMSRGSACSSKAPARPSSGSRGGAQTRLRPRAGRVRVSEDRTAGSGSACPDRWRPCGWNPGRCPGRFHLLQEGSVRKQQFRTQTAASDLTRPNSDVCLTFWPHIDNIVR